MLPFYVLGLIFACVVFGIATGIAKDRGKPFLNFFKSASAVVIIILQWFLWWVLSSFDNNALAMQYR